MRRSTTSVATEPARSRYGLLAAVILTVATALSACAGSSPSAVQPSSTAAASTSAAPVSTTLADGRVIDILVLGDRGDVVAQRVSAELDGAADAVTRFWGDDWPRRLEIVLTGTAEQFEVLGGGASDIAATTTAERIVFAPGAADMSPDALRIVLRHELFHYAARADTAPDAPRWLTEGVADFVARPVEPVPGPARAAELAVLPTDADLDTEGEIRSAAYDRAWWFSRFVADRYGETALRDLYLAACGVDRVDTDTAIAEVLGTDTERVLTEWRSWLAG